MDGTAVALESTPAIEEITEAERKTGFDYTSQYYLGISGDEFLRKLDAHELPDNDPRVDKVLLRLWLVRPQPAEG
jgi:hypothetical protein